MTKSRTFSIADYIREDRIRNLEIQLGWTTDDVLRRRPDLDHKQAWQVLLDIAKNHEFGIGETWTAVDAMAQKLFGDARSDEE